MNQNKILICGLPSSGKTSYLAALWYLLFHKEIPTALSLATLPATRDYLNSLSKKWTRTVEIDHTPTDEVQEITLRLKDENNVVELHIPDMSGETWDHIWVNRSCAVHAAEWANDAIGIMFFVHSDKIRNALDIITHNAMIGVEGKDAIDGELTEWSPEKSPTQVILVDILQSLALPPLGNGSRRIAVIISAWDKAEDAGMEPEEYLRVHLPLLHQFLRYSDYFTAVKIFGVSAIGGDLLVPAWHINEVSASHNGKVVMTADWGPAVSKKDRKSTRLNSSH